MKKKFILLVVAVTLVAAMLVGCKSKNANDGVYKLSSMMGMTVEQLDAFSDGEESIADMFKMEIKGNKATFTADGESEEATVKIDGKNIEIALSGETIKGTIEDGNIVINEEGVELILTKEGAKPKEPTPSGLEGLFGEETEEAIEEDVVEGLEEEAVEEEESAEK